MMTVPESAFSLASTCAASASCTRAGMWADSCGFWNAALRAPDAAPGGDAAMAAGGGGPDGGPTAPGGERWQRSGKTRRGQGQEQEQTEKIGENRG